MSSKNDPIRRLKQCVVATLVVGAICITGIALWAWRPLPEAQRVAINLNPVQPIDSDPEAHKPSNSTDIDLDAFLAVLWHELAPVTVDQKKDTPPPAPEPLRVQLVAIIEDNGLHHAALYDEREDRIVMIADGGRIGEHDVRVTADAVQFTRDGRSQELLLQPKHKHARGGRS